MWVAIHTCMEATLRIPLCSSFYLKLAKNSIFLIISYVFSSTKSENKVGKQVLPGRGGAQIMYTHVSKSKNDKEINAIWTNRNKKEYPQHRKK
jgi:hypothetical protein